jgi:hypothetical protein
MQTTPHTGTVISATMNPRDLIPAFTAAALTLANTDAEARQLGEIRKRATAPGYYDTEDADFDLEELFDLLDNAAPAGHYFGSHPGDGSDYGFWESDAPGIDNEDEPELTPEN